jgi:hypothetical protein
VTSGEELLRDNISATLDFLSTTDADFVTKVDSATRLAYNSEPGLTLDLSYQGLTNIPPYWMILISDSLERYLMLDGY